MAKGRILDKQMHTNEELARCSIEARYLYKGMIMHADDEGRMKASPIFLKAVIFPFDEVIRVDTVKRWRDNLASIGVIKLYAAGGKEYLVHPNWDKWQPLRKDRTKRTECPATGDELATKWQPDDNQLSTTGKPSATNRKKLETKEEKRESLPDVSLSTPLPSLPSKERKEERGIATKNVALRSEKPPHVSFVEGFQRVYQEFTGASFKIDQKHWAIAAGLLKNHGVDECVQKAKVLGVMCKNRSAWFTKDGFGSFTLETLSSKWNNIIPEAMPVSKDDELRAELKRREEMRVRSDAIVNGAA